jgi:hypothetical protein
MPRRAIGIGHPPPTSARSSDALFVVVFFRAIAALAFAMSAESGYAWLTSDRVPRRDDIVVVEGAVTHVDYARTSSHSSNAVTGVRFWLPQEDKLFYYGSFLPNFRRVQEHPMVNALKLVIASARHGLTPAPGSGQRDPRPTCTTSPGLTFSITVLSCSNNDS